MKKSILYIFGLALAFGATSCNSDEPADATSKHVYVEGEVPYLRANPAATNTIAHNFLAARIEEPLVISLKDYAPSFHKNLNMTVDETLTALANGEVKFYTINTGRQRWNLDEPSLGASGWYYNTANMPVASSEDAAFSMELDSKAKTVTVRAVNDPAVGSMTTMDFGFALDNGKDYDDYVRFMISCSVSDPSTVILDAVIPAGGYNAYGINLKDFAEAIELCMGMPYADFVTAMDNEEIEVYLCDADGNWVLDADGNRPGYTSGWLGYWLDSDLNITGWDGGGYPANLMFLEYGGGGTYNLGNSASSTPAGTQVRLRFDLVANGDPATAVHFIINVTFG